MRKSSERDAVEEGREGVGGEEWKTGGWMEGRSGGRSGFWGGVERGDWWGRVLSGIQEKSEAREMEKGRVERGVLKRGKRGG